ncbi:hypothetical protein PTSG_04120 [Salpingoeca rosetta]|uniref:Uncharacterized protein n=1 Tax=Salpingoeca rosetta (strain ATCC 50818 / BSB-021) TaxID=946362 RepID=F2U6N0_SALR5|nr:uncharacterized protein PTSG_04120 [Salpingoeca rosetta]EGD83512.1 hypothetical protein PTSG_04120 [Salpingoeca rosetta]|eukprot:XP_004995016.1 hypothetical protein PTSG_04120 [Salpingoeca rosetta]
MNDDAIVKQGWLRKSPPAGVMKAWKKRYFCLKRKTAQGAARLEYYAETNKAARGVIDLRTCISIEEAHHEPEKSRYNFRIVTQGRTYTLQAPSYDEMKEWMKVICDEVFPPDDGRAKTATLPKQQPPAMAARAQLAVPTQDAPRRTSISFKRRPVVAPGPRAKPHHPQPSPSCPWLYGKISRQQTESLLADYGLQDGLFLVRESSQPGAFAISVCYKGKVVHHLVRPLPTGTFQVNEHECGECTSLDEVIDYLETPKGPPLNWRYELKVCPKTYDEQQTGGADKPPAEMPPLPPRTDGVQNATDPAGSGRSFPATLLNVRSTNPLSVAQGAPCMVRIGAGAVTLVDSTTSLDACTWPITSIFDFGVEPAQGSFFLRSNDDQCGGEFHFQSQSAFDMLALLRQQLPPMSRQASVKPPVAKKPPPRPGKTATLPKHAAIAEEPGSQYEKPIDAAEMMKPDTSKPMPPPITAEKPSASALKNDSLKQSLAGVLQGQAETLRSGGPRAPLRRPESYIEPDADAATPTAAATSSSSSKRTSVADIGVAIPGVGAFDITKARSGLKKTQAQQQPEAIAEEQEEPAAEDPSQQQPQQPQEAVRPALTPQTAVDAEDMGEEYLAGCDFTPGPEAVDRLAFEEGQIILILKKPNENWWLGRLGDKEGWVPASFMDPLDADPMLDAMDEDPAIAQAMAAVQNADAALQRLGSRAQELSLNQ